MKKQVFYLSGPMRGLKRYGYARFAAAAKLLRKAGFKVISPHELDAEVDFDPDKTLKENHFDMELAVRRDLEAIIRADAVVTLPGWKSSTGAKAEVAIAKWLDKPVYSIRRFRK